MANDSLQITLLCDNIVHHSGLLAEHGLALWVAGSGGPILLDTGPSHVAVHNADRLGLDLSRVQAIVLSHGHYDHTGGLRTVLERTGPIPIFAHPDVFADKVARSATPGQEPRSIRSPFTPEELERWGARFTWTPETQEIAPGVWVSGEVPRDPAFAPGDERLCVRQGGALGPDPLRDDMSLFVTTPEGTVVLTGCAHAGLVNIVRQALAVTGTPPLKAVVGGTHLLRAHPDLVSRTAAILDELGVEQVVASHCTGLGAAHLLQHTLGERLVVGQVGGRWTF